MALLPREICLTMLIRPSTVGVMLLDRGGACQALLGEILSPILIRPAMVPMEPSIPLLLPLFTTPLPLLSVPVKRDV